MKGKNVGFLDTEKQQQKKPENPKKARQGSSKLVIVGCGKPAIHRVVFSTFCRTCGKDISGQPGGGAFCSERHLGKAARRCRDLAHNDRRRAARQTDAARLLDLFERLGEVTVSIQIFQKSPTDPGGSMLLATVTPATLLGQKFPGILSVTRAEVGTLGGECHTFERKEAKKLLRFFGKKPPALSPDGHIVAPAAPLGEVLAVAPVAVAPIVAPIASPVADARPNRPPPAPTQSVPPMATAPPARPTTRTGETTIGDVLNLIFPNIKKS